MKNQGFISESIFQIKLFSILFFKLDPAGNGHFENFETINAKLR